MTYITSSNLPVTWRKPSPRAQMTTAETTGALLPRFRRLIHHQSVPAHHCCSSRPQAFGCVSTLSAIQTEAASPLTQAGFVERP